MSSVLKILKGFHHTCIWAWRPSFFGGHLGHDPGPLKQNFVPLPLGCLRKCELHARIHKVLSEVKRREVPNTTKSGPMMAEH